MTFFDVPSDAYERFMGRFSRPLSGVFVDHGLTGVESPDRLLDVGCGTGVLTGELISRFGADRISAVDPAPTFVAATAAAYPDVDVREASAEELPYDDATFTAALAQLVVHFMDDPVKGVREMRRVTRRGGRVSACVWDHGGGRGPLSLFWDIARRLDPNITDESDLAGSRAGDLERIFVEAGLAHVEEGALRVGLELAGFEDWWEPYTFGVGPVGSYVRSLDPGARLRLEQALLSEVGDEPFRMDVSAWAAVGTA